jgi:hypothetical protein
VPGSETKQLASVTYRFFTSCDWQYGLSTRWSSGRCPCARRRIQCSGWLRRTQHESSGAKALVSSDEIIGTRLPRVIDRVITLEPGYGSTEVNGNGFCAIARSDLVSCFFAYSRPARTAPD